MKKEFKPDKEEGTELREDTAIKKALAPLKILKIPLELRETNEQSIHNALIQKTKSLRISWWQRRIAVPFPAVAGFVAIFSVLLLLQISQIGWHPKGNQQIEHGPLVNDKSTHTGATQTREDRAYHYESAIYVAGMGFIERECGHIFIQENYHENN